MKYFIIDIESQCIVKSYGTYQDSFEEWSTLSRNVDKVKYVICTESEIVNLAKEKYDKQPSQY